MLPLLHYTLVDLLHYRSRTILAIIALSGVSFSYLILASLSESMFSFGTSAPQTRNLVVIPRDVMDPMDARIGEDLFEVTGDLPPDLVQQISPHIFRHMRIDDEVVQLRAASVADWETVYGLVLTEGQWPGDGREVAISEDAAIVTGWHLDRQLRIFGSDFWVSGIFRGSGSEMASVWMPVEQAHRLLFGADVGYQMAYLRIPADADAEAVRGQLEAEPRLGGRYAVYHEDRLTERFLQIINDIRDLLAIVAGIALLGITFGSFNAANMDVAERQRELGILRAIGLPVRLGRTILMVRVGLQSMAAYGIGVLIAAIFLSSHHAREFLVSSGLRLSLQLTPLTILAGLALVLLLAPLGAWLSTRRLGHLPVNHLVNR
jgi:hypothetical protein